MNNKTLFQKFEKIKKVDLIKFVKYNFLIGICGKYLQAHELESGMPL